MVMRVCVPDDVAAGSYRLLFRTSGTDSANREIRDWLPTAVGGERETIMYSIGSTALLICFQFGYPNYVTTV